MTVTATNKLGKAARKGSSRSICVKKTREGSQAENENLSEYAY